MNPDVKAASKTAAPLGRDTMSSGLVEARNYHLWNYDWIAPYVHGRMLDIGGGTGNHLTFLHDRELVSIDLSSDCVAELRELHRDRRNWHFEVGDITDPAIIDRFGAQSFDTVLSCNVFEHIENDGAAFANSAALLKPGGRLVLLLPAHPALFGSMDRLAGHHRRYTAADAERKLAAADLKVEALRYVNLVGALGWYVNSRPDSPSRPVLPGGEWADQSFRSLHGPDAEAAGGTASDAVRSVARVRGSQA